MLHQEVYRSVRYTSFFLDSHTRGHTEGGGDGRKDGNSDVDDFLPNFVLVHSRLVLVS